MADKFILTGLMLAMFWLIPALTERAEVDPPYWVKVVVVLSGGAGFSMVFFGALARIWA